MCFVETKLHFSEMPEDPFARPWGPQKRPWVGLAAFPPLLGGDSPLAAKTLASYHGPPLFSNSGLPYSSLRPPIFQLRSLLYPISLLPSPKKLPNNLPATKKMTKYFPPAPLHPSKPPFPFIKQHFSQFHVFRYKTPKRQPLATQRLPNAPRRLPKASQRVSKGTQNHTKDPLEDHKNHHESTTSPQDHPNRSPTTPLTHKTPPKDLQTHRKTTFFHALSQQP